MKPNWLALKIALLMAATVAALVLVANIATGGIFPGWMVVSAPIAIGLAAYIVAYVILHRRLEFARTTLKQIRKHQFENLDAAHLPRGDELNALIWQVYRTGQVLEAEIQELKKMENYRREFIGNVSHELKTPIFTIHGFAETLLDGAIDDPGVNRAFAEKIMRNANRLSNLAEDLSEIARIETGELKMHPEPFDLKKVILELVESLEYQAAEKNVSLYHSLPDDLPRAVGDRERIRQVISNLIDNAIKYNDSGGRVEVSVQRRPGNHLLVVVRDDGIGIAPEHVERLTERFYRVDQSRSRDEGGTGLGLAIVKHILGAHHSRLKVESSPGEGTSIGFRLRSVHSPRMEESAETDESPVLPAAPPPAP